MERMDKYYYCHNRNSCGVVQLRGEELYILKGSKRADCDTPSYLDTGKSIKLSDEGIVKDNIFTQDYLVKSITSAVSILGRHGVSSAEAEKKSEIVSEEKALQLLREINSDIEKEIQSDTDNEYGLNLIEIDELITDAIFQKLRANNQRTNIFEIVGQTHTEHWHSSFLKWLFSAQDGLGLGTFALERLLNLYIYKKGKSCIDYSDIDNLDLNLMEFQTEKTFSYNKLAGWYGGSIDVYGENRNLIICIENKVFAKEEIKNGTGQTVLYYRYLEERKEEGQKILYFFITPDPNQQPACEEFVQITYQEIYNHVISKCINNPEISADDRNVLEQYSNNLKNSYKRDKDNYPMALTHIAECQRLFEKYPKQINAIYYCASRGLEKTAEYSCYRKYKKTFDELFLSLDDFDQTPDKSMTRVKITFHDLVNQNKLLKTDTFSMKYDDHTYHAKIVLNKQRWCMALLDEEGQVIKGHDSYETASTPAKDAVYLYRCSQGDVRDKPSISGPSKWYIDRLNKSLGSVMSE